MTPSVIRLRNRNDKINNAADVGKNIVKNEIINRVTVKNAKTLFDLCDCLLIIIFTYLNTLDLYHMAKISQHFKHIICNHVIPNHILDVGKIDYFGEIIKLFGANSYGLIIVPYHIKIPASGRSKTDEMLHLIYHYFNNLKDLSITVDLKDSVNTEYIEQFAQKISTIKKLTVSSTYTISDARDYNTHSMKRSKLMKSLFSMQLNNIEKLTLQKFTLDMLKPLSTLSNLSALALEECSVDLYDLRDLMKLLGDKLKYFSFYGEDSDIAVGDEKSDIIDIVKIFNEYNPNLTELRLEGLPYDYKNRYFNEKIIQNLTKLEKLSLFVPWNRINDEMRKFISCCSHIKHITINMDLMYYLDDTYDDYSLKVLKELNDLKSITINGSNYCDNLRDTFDCMEVTDGLNFFKLKKFKITQNCLIDFMASIKNVRCFDISESEVKISKSFYRKLLTKYKLGNKQYVIKVNSKSVIELKNYDEKILKVA